MKKLIAFFKDEEGVTAVEYAVMVALIAIVVIAGATLLGQRTNQTLNNAHYNGFRGGDLYPPSDAEINKFCSQF